jgi:hypothetical protein
MDGTYNIYREMKNAYQFFGQEILIDRDRSLL